MELFLIVLLLLIFGSALAYVVATYNRFQTLKNGAEATLGQVQVALKKRLDMISQLVDSVKSYAKFEKETFERITELRSSLMRSKTSEDMSRVERQISSLLGNIMLTVENYPDLKTSQVVQELTSAIKSIEAELARHRYTYNNIVQEFNTKIDTFPSNFVAGMFSFTKMGYLEFEEEVQRRPDVTWGV